MNAVKRISESVDFMLAEYSHLSELWRHTDARTEAAVNFYLTTAAVLIPVTLLVKQSFSDLGLFLWSGIAVAAVFAVLGSFVSRRISRSHEIKGEYILALNLIRKYFVDQDSSLLPYLSFDVAGSRQEQLRRRQSGRTVSLRSFVMAVFFVNCLLVGFIAGSLAWLLASREMNHVGACGLAGVLIGAALQSIGSRWLVGAYK
jgi:MFS family permease